MPPPVSYFDITSLPTTHTITSAEFNAGTYGGITNQAWLRFTVSTTAPIGFYTTTSGTTDPYISLIAADGDTIYQSIEFKKGWWRYLPAATYFLQVSNRLGGSSPDDFIVSVSAGAFASLPLPSNSLLINDDSRIETAGPLPDDPFPATAWTTGGTFLGFVPDIPAGEIGDALPSGIMLVHNGVSGSGDALTLYDANQASLGPVTVSGVAVGSSYPSITNDGTQFYVMARPSRNVYTVSDAGVVAGPIVSTLTGSINAIGVSRDGTTLYYTKAADPIIYRHNTVTDTPLSNLFTLASIGYATPTNIARTPNSHPGEILVLSDQSIVTTYRNASPAIDGILHVGSTGTLLHNHEYNASTEARLDHIHYTSFVADDTISAWMFLEPDTDHVARIGRYSLTTGAFVTSFDRRMFSLGVAESVTSDTFGPSSSCFLLSTGYDLPPQIPGTVPTCCDTTSHGGGTTPNPVGPLPPWMANCTDGGVVDSVADLTDGEVW